MRRRRSSEVRRSGGTPRVSSVLIKASTTSSSMRVKPFARIGGTLMAGLRRREGGGRADGLPCPPRPLCYRLSPALDASAPFSFLALPALPPFPLLLLLPERLLLLTFSLSVVSPDVAT